MKHFANIFFVIVFCAGGIPAIAMPTRNLPPEFCRDQCANHPNGGYCFEINKPYQIVLRPLINLLTLARSPQSAYDSFCKQDINITMSTFSISGKTCRVERTTPIGAKIVAEVGETQGTIFRNGNILELSFLANNPTWDVGSTLNPPLGQNPIQYLTEGYNPDGTPALVLFDGYFCNSIEMN